MKKGEKTKVKNQGISKLFLLYNLMIIFLVVSCDLASYQFSVFKYPVFASAFLYPFLFLVADAITLEYGEQQTIKAILLALIVQVLIFLVVGWMDGEINGTLILATSLSYMLGQAINLYMCTCIDKKEKKMTGHLFIQYAFVILVETLVFTLWMREFCTLAVLLGSILFSYLIKMVIATALVFVEKYYIRLAD